MDLTLKYEFGCNECNTAESIIKNLTFHEYNNITTIGTELKTEHEIIKELLISEGQNCSICNSKNLSFYNLKVNSKKLEYRDKPFYLELTFDKIGNNPINVKLGGSENSGRGFLGRAFSLIESELINCSSNTFTEKDNGNANFVVSHSFRGDFIELFRYRGISKKDILNVLNIVRQDMKNANPRGF